MRRDPIGIWFDVARAKTGRKAIAKLRTRTARLLQAYIASLPAQPIGAVKFRRSGATEALAGNVSPEKLSKKVANTLSPSNRLHHTYAPVQLASVRDVDAVRKAGRAELPFGIAGKAIART